MNSTRRGNERRPAKKRTMNAPTKKQYAALADDLIDTLAATPITNRTWKDIQAIASLYHLAGDEELAERWQAITDKNRRAEEEGQA